MRTFFVAGIAWKISQPSTVSTDINSNIRFGRIRADIEPLHRVSVAPRIAACDGHVFVELDGAAERTFGHVSCTIAQDLYPLSDGDVATDRLANPRRRRREAAPPRGRILMAHTARKLVSTIAAVALAAGGVAAATSANAAPAPAAPKAAVAGALPKACQVNIHTTTSELYMYDKKVSRWSGISLPREGARFTWFNSAADEVPLDERFHRIAVTSKGQVYDSSFLVGGLGDGWHLDEMKEPKHVAAGRTIAGIVDLETASEAVGDDDTWRPTKFVYAVTADGRMYSIPITYSKNSPRLGKPVELKATGLSGIRGIETLGRAWDKGKVTRDFLIGHTKDGRLVELTVNRTKAVHTLTYKVMAKGWGKVSAIAVGWCGNKAYQNGYALVAIDNAKRVTAYLDPKWNDASLEGVKALRLAPWTKSAPANVF